jgi:excisionase family DNA binding protein
MVFPPVFPRVSGAATPRPARSLGNGNTASDFLKVPEAAEAFGVSERTIRNWINAGQLPAIQPAGPNHAIRVDRRELLRSDRRSEDER